MLLFFLAFFFVNACLGFLFFLFLRSCAAVRAIYTSTTHMAWAMQSICINQSTRCQQTKAAVRVYVASAGGGGGGGGAIALTATTLTR
jgi:hypothetical protein